MALLDALLGVDPLKAITELITVAVLLIILFGMYQHWDRVMLALTGDTHMHVSCLDVGWYLVRCGDMCTGEGTRWLTRLPCVPKKYRNVNLVRALGRCLGFASHSVEIRNITIGDLPFSGVGDFYITVECKANPDQVTSLAERKEQYVVHFPEVMTLRMRYSPFEEKVKIRVYELNVFGATELCYVHLNAMSVIEWSSENSSTMYRFEMKPVDTTIELETQPWILLEVGECLEPRDLENLHGQTNMVRTATQGGPCVDRTLKEFKEEFVLRDAGGQAIVEPDEDDLHKLKTMRWTLVAQMWLLNTSVALALLVYFPWRFYLMSCWMQFEGLTMAKMSNRTFPISIHDLHELEKKCRQDMQGTGIAVGVPCRPSAAQIIDTCHAPPAEQPWPGAGRMIISRLFGVEFSGLRCASPVYGVNHTLVDALGPNNYAGIWSLTNDVREFFLSEGGVCEMREKIRPFDVWMLLVSFLLVLATFVFRCAGNKCVRRYKNYLHGTRARVMQEARSEVKRLLPAHA